MSGTGPIREDGSFDDDVGAQARRRLEIIDAVGPVHAEFFGTARPAATAVVVAALLDPRWKVGIEAEAVVPD